MMLQIGNTADPAIDLTDGDTDPPDVYKNELADFYPNIKKIMKQFNN